MSKEQIVDFWNLLGHNNLGFTEIRFIGEHPRKFYVRDISELQTILGQDFTNNHAYIGINPRRTTGSGSLENISYLVNLVLDLDELTVPVGDLVKMFPDQTIIHSGRGLHVYFPIQPIAINESNKVMVTETCKNFTDMWRSKIGTMCKVDHVYDLPRVMRIPGTINIKNGRMAEIIQYKCKVTKLEDLVKMGVAEVKTVTPSYNVIEMFDRILAENQDLRRAVNRKTKSPSERVFFLVKNLVPYGFNDAEIQTIIEHFSIGRAKKSYVKDVSRIIEKVRKEISLKPASTFWNYYLSSIGKRTVGDSYGLPKLDKMTGGLRRGEAILVGAGTGVGKTTMVMNWVHSLLKQNKSILMFGTEMSFEALMDKLVVLYTGVPLENLRNNTLNDAQKKLVRDLEPTIKSMKLFISDIGSPSYLDVIKEAKKIKPDIVILDFIQMVDEGMGDTRARILDLFAKQLKVSADKLGFSLILTSQLNDLELLRDSRAISHPLEVTCKLNEYGEDSRGYRKLVLKINKNRYGALGDIPMYMEPGTGRIVEA